MQRTLSHINESPEQESMKRCARLKRLGTVKAIGESDRPPKFEFAYLKLLVPVSVSKCPDGRCEYEERPGEAPPNQSRVNDENVMTIAVALTLYYGSSVLLPKFDPAAVVDAIEQFQCTLMACMPALWQLVLAEQERAPRRVSTLTCAAAGGDAVPVALQDRFRTVFGVPLQECYGLPNRWSSRSIPSNHCVPARLGSRCQAWDSVLWMLEVASWRWGRPSSP